VAMQTVRVQTPMLDWSWGQIVTVDDTVPLYAALIAAGRLTPYTPTAAEAATVMDRNTVLRLADLQTDTSPARQITDSLFAPLLSAGPLRGMPVGDGGIVTGGDTTRTGTGTYRCPHYINVTSTDLRFEWHNWKNNGTSLSPNYADSDGAAAVTIRASVEIGGVIYRLTFGGRTDVTIDPGGYVQSDPLPLDVPAGTLIYSRTYVVSGSWHYTRYALVASGQGGASGNGVDLTAPGSGAIADAAFTAMFAPTAITGKPLGDSNVPAVYVVGDSIGAGGNDFPSTTPFQSRSVTAPQLSGNGFLARAFHGKVGHLNSAVPGSGVQQFITDSGHFRRLTFARSCSTMVMQYGRNDLSGGRTAAQLQADLVTAWRMGAQRGLRVIQTTITPRSATTDGWRTTGGQSFPSVPQETARVAVNNWIRDGAPVSTDGNFTPLAVGASSALRAGRGGHPLFGYWEIADRVETARNSGIWKAWTNTRSVSDANIAAGGNGLTSATAAFTSADLGRSVFIAGAGAAGGDYYSMIQGVGSATSANPNANATTAVTGGQAVIGDGYTLDGTHPTPYAHTQAVAGVDLSMLA
jgi:hypothetical protein